MFNFLGLKLFYLSIIAVIVAIIALFIKSFFIPLLLALFIAMVLRPLVIYFESKGFSQTAIISTIFTVFFTLLIFGFVAIFPLLGDQAASLSQKVPQIISTLQNKAVYLSNKADEMFPFLNTQNMLEDIYSVISKNINNTSGMLVSYISDMMNILTFAILVPFFAFFLLKDMHMIKKTILSYIPNKYFEVIAILLYKIGNSVQLYIRGQLIDATFVGVMTSIGLSIIGFPFALVVGLIAGIGNFIPYFGPILGAIPAALIILVTPEWSTFYGIGMVIAVFAIVQTIETVFIYPNAVGNSVNLHPIVVVLALLAGGELAGVVGMIVMIPFVAILKLTFEHLHRYVKEYKVFN